MQSEVDFSWGLFWKDKTEPNYFGGFGVWLLFVCLFLVVFLVGLLGFFVKDVPLYHEWYGLTVFSVNNYQV